MCKNADSECLISGKYMLENIIISPCEACKKQRLSKIMNLRWNLKKNFDELLVRKWKYIVWTKEGMMLYPMIKAALFYSTSQQMELKLAGELLEVYVMWLLYEMRVSSLDDLERMMQSMCLWVLSFCKR